jgi:hypothetical protein
MRAGVLTAKCPLTKAIIPTSKLCEKPVSAALLLSLARNKNTPWRPQKIEIVEIRENRPRNGKFIAPKFTYSSLLTPDF